MNVAVIYGGRSVEHDVSILTAMQAMEALSVRHRVLPVYISRGGRWYSDESLRKLSTYGEGEPEAREIAPDLSGGTLKPLQRGRFGRRDDAPTIDVVLPATHGTFGEDGALQGLLELAGVPYAGSSVAASAAAMDKALTKAVLARAGVPIVESVEISRREWEDDRDAALERAASVGAPAYVKPLSLGSSIGVTRTVDRAALADALELALELDRVALVEPSVEHAMEVNCAVLGHPAGDVRTSVLEQPLSDDAFLSFEDKYLQGGKAEGMKGAQRIIPAPLADDVAARVADLSARAFRALGCSGVVRVDCLIAEDGAVYVNELNTIPGSFAFYLWEPAGLPFDELLERMLEIALAEHAAAAATTRSFPSALLASRAAGVKS